MYRGKEEAEPCIELKERNQKLNYDELWQSTEPKQMCHTKQQMTHHSRESALPHKESNKHAVHCSTMAPTGCSPSTVICPLMKMINDECNQPAAQRAGLVIPGA